MALVMVVVAMPVTVSAVPPVITTSATTTLAAPALVSRSAGTALAAPALVSRSTTATVPPAAGPAPTADTVVATSATPTGRRRDLGREAEAHPQVLTRRRHHGFDGLGTGLLAEPRPDRYPPLLVGRGFARVDRRTGEVVQESEGDDPPGDRLTDAVLQRDDEGIRHQLARLSLLAVAGDDGEGSGISRAGKRQVSAAAGGEHQHEQDRGGRGAHTPRL